MPPIFTIDQLEPYICRPIIKIYMDIIEPERNSGVVSKVIRTDENAEPYILAAIEMIKGMGFECIDEMKPVWLPVVAAFFQYHHIQRANESTDLPYQTIRNQYQDTLLWLEQNKDICSNSEEPVKPNNILGLFKYRKRSGRLSGW